MLELADVTKPEPRDDEVLIKVRAASVNPLDYKIRAGTYPVVKQDQLPQVLGRDVAGEIESCGRARAQLQGGRHGLCNARRRPRGLRRVCDHQGRSGGAEARAAGLSGRGGCAAGCSRT